MLIWFVKGTQLPGGGGGFFFFLLGRRGGGGGGGLFFIQIFFYNLHLQIIASNFPKSICREFISPVGYFFKLAFKMQF